MRVYVISQSSDEENPGLVYCRVFESKARALDLLNKIATDIEDKTGYEAEWDEAGEGFSVDDPSENITYWADLQETDLE